MGSERNNRLRAFVLAIALLYCGACFHPVHAQQSVCKLSGYVTAEESGECLIGAVIWSGENWATSNEYGFYSLNLQGGEHTVKCSYLGRESEDLKIIIKGDVRHNFVMFSVESINGAFIEDEIVRKLPSAYMGALDIPSEFVKQMPTVLGEPDLLKTVQKMPGVQSGVEGFSGIYVRGGGSEENLMLLDGAPLYNSTHVFGLFSSFNPESIKQVTLYKGFFPAKYGGRTSSVIDVRTKEGNTKKLKGSVSAGLFNARFNLEGPIVKDRTSFSLSVRGLNSLVLYPVFKLAKSPYYFAFYDLTGKLTHRFGNSDRLVISAYHGRDFFDYQQSKSKVFSYRDENDYPCAGMKTDTEQYYMRWGNTMASVRWNHSFGGKLFSDLSFSWTNYRKREKSSKLNEIILSDADSDSGSKICLNSSDISDFNLNWDLEYSLTPSQSLGFGLMHTLHCYNPESYLIQKNSVFEGGEDQSSESLPVNTIISIKGRESSLYFQDDINIAGRFNASVGLRATLFSVSGKYYPSLEPRLTAEYKILQSLSVKAAYSRMSQYSHLLASGSMSLPTDLWVPITKNIKPIFSNIVSAGLSYSLADMWDFSLEAYYKKEKNVLEYKDGRTIFTESGDWEKSVEMGTGESKGVELYARKTKGKLTGMLSYTLSKTDRVFPDGTINGGKPFPFTYDRRHVIDIFAKYSFNDRISLNASWNYSSGNMMTVSWRNVQLINPNGNGERNTAYPYISGRNNYRLPPSHRLDASVSFRKEKRRGERIWTFGVYNLYAARNPNWVVIDSDAVVDEDGTGHSDVYLSKRTFLTIVPSFSYTFIF